ncbi:MAG: class I SAM-dependent methyltransferase [Candidatus Nomurabacteria bacterium]
MNDEVSKSPSYTELWAEKNLAKLYAGFRTVLNPGEVGIAAEVADIIENTNQLPQTVNMLDLGAGSGESTLRIVKKLSEKHNIVYHGIDVSEEQRTSFRLKASGLPDNVDINSYQITSWENFTPNKYDLIISYHSWYGITGDDSILKLRDSLTPNGSAYVLLSFNKSLALLAMQHNGEKTYAADDFINDLNRLGVPFEEKEFGDASLNRDSFIKDGKLTKTGKDFLGYLYRRPIDDGLEKIIIPWINTLPDEAFSAPGAMIKITNSPSPTAS